MVFYLNSEEMQIETLLDKPVSETKELLSGSGNKLNLPLRRLREPAKLIRPIGDQKLVNEAAHDHYTIQELESGTIHVLKDEVMESTSKPALRLIARDLGISILNTNGNPMNTRQLGSRLIKEIESRNP